MLSPKVVLIPLLFSALALGLGAELLPISAPSGIASGRAPDLAALRTDGALPAVTWRQDAHGTWAQIPLPSAPYPGLGSPRSDVLIALPPGYSGAQGIWVTAHLHGHSGALDPLVAEQRLRQQLNESGRDAILIVPQGPYQRASGDFGALMAAGGFARLLSDVLTLLRRDGRIPPGELRGAALTAHSGGYRAAAAILNHGGVPITAVSLFDALYGEVPTFEAFAKGGGIFRSVWTSGGRTGENNRLLAKGLRAQGLEVSDALSDAPLRRHGITIAYTPASHTGCIAENQGFARLLEASGLPKVANTPRRGGP